MVIFTEKGECSNLMDKAMTKEEFKARWESNEEGGGITFDDIADCAKAWGLYSRPKCAPINLVTYNVCKAANIKKEDMPPNPDEKEGKKKRSRREKADKRLCLTCVSFRL